MKKKGLNPNSLKLVYSKLPEWLQSKNDFTQTKKLLNDIRIDLANGGVGCKDKKAFNDLTRLITYISNNQVKKENAIKRTNKTISALNQLSKKRYSFLK